MNFVEELTWRSMMHTMTLGAEEKLLEGPQKGYIGFDPTAPSMTIGNYVQIMLLSFWQKSGHQPIILMGGATGRVGDPSGKDSERQLKSYDELDINLQFQVEQARKFLDFDGPNKAILVNNLDFYKDMDVLSFLRNVGKTLTVNYMMSKDSVKNRLETGLSFTEFSYQLLQAYDFQRLYSDLDCRFQMGGSDQWGNITSGTEFIRRNVDGKAYAITTPLLTKSDGKKFGKSEEGNIWLDPHLTSPYKFYQFWIDGDDADTGKFLRYFSYRSQEEVEALEKEHPEDSRPIKKLLAEELTERVHSIRDLKNAQSVSELLFNKRANSDFVHSMSADALETVAEAIPAFEIDAGLFSSGTSIIDLIADHTRIVNSKGEARRSIQNNAVSVNKIKVTSLDHIIGNEQLVHGKYLLVENGKKHKYLIKAME